MDIVNLDVPDKIKRQKRHRSAARRHTTEVRFSLLGDKSLADVNRNSALSLSDENISNDAVVDSSRYDKGNIHLTNGQEHTSMSSSSSWNSLFDVGDFESPPDSDYNYFEGSQTDVFNELSSSTKPSNHLDVAKHQYQLSYELALDNVLTPFADHGPAVASPLMISSRQKPKLSHVGHVIHEMTSTEKAYIRDLTEVIDGYSVPLLSRVGALPVRETDLVQLFGNITEIRDFHQSLLASLKECGNDPEKIGVCFLREAESFKIYTQYCNNYPSSVNVLTQLTQDTNMSRFMKICQQRLNHMLPLGAYLLKPVQRVLKYSLLLRDMLKHIRTDADSYHTVKCALQKMTDVAEHINAMKKKYDAAVHVQEMQSLIRGTEGLDLSKYGELILEENFRYSGGKSTGSTFRGRTERYVFLFQQLCLITKKEEDGYQYKTHLEMKDLQLTEKVEKDPNSFHIRQVSTGRAYTFQARTLEQKQSWVRAIKLQLMDSLPELSDKTKEMILKGFPTASGLADSPSRSRHRHHSEEPVLPSMLLTKADAAKRKAKTLGHGTLPNMVQSGKKPRGRSTTSPNIKTGINPATFSLVQASLTGLLSSSVYQQEIPAVSPSEPLPTLQDDDVIDESSRSVQSNGDVRDSGYSETNGIQDESNRHYGVDDDNSSDTILLTFTDRIRTPSPQDCRVLEKSTSSPQLGRKVYSIQEKEKPTKTQLPKVELGTGQDSMHDVQPSDIDPVSQAAEETIEDHNMSPVRMTRIDSVDSIHSEQSDRTSTDMEVEIVSTNFGTEQPDVEIEIEQDVPSHFLRLNRADIDHTATPDPEDLFDELMGNFPATPPSSGNLSQTEWMEPNIDIPSSGINTNDGSTLTETPSDPPITPDHQANSTVSSDGTPEDSLADENATPRASPYVSPASIRRWSVKKRHSCDQADPDSQTTPKASPYVRRHKTVHNPQYSPVAYRKKTSPVLDPPSEFQQPGRLATEDNNVEGDLTTSKTRRSSIVRRHSFGSHAKRIILAHQKQGSLSTDNSPHSSPRPRNKKKSKKSKYQPSSPLSSPVPKTISKSEISVVGLIGTSRAELSLDELSPIPTEQCGSVSDNRMSIILPPPHEFNLPLVDDAPSRDSQVNPEVATTPDLVTRGERLNNRDELSPEPKKKSRFTFQRGKRGSKTKANGSPEERIHSPDIIVTPPESETESSYITALPPLQSNPEELLSFDEILESFDHYSSKTGKTNKSAYRPKSPQPKKKNKKKRRDRSLTVANIDADTMRQVKEEVARNQLKSVSSGQLRDASYSKVQKLAREYSQRIKDDDRVRLTRFSMVVEETSYAPKEIVDSREPDWLQKLRERKKSSNRSSREGSEEAVPHTPDSEEQFRETFSDNEITTMTKHEPDQDMKRRAQTLKYTTSDKSRDSEMAHAAGHDDPHKKGRFRGWVRSLVDKFSTK